ncbi:hypothetical protein PSV08DRAFT_355045 [Bipolaris maydis]|uniref:uncharacterized protein n=1 Tax=Cochliobolus heterostrophus TaxID=5016 RepID=UPI0024DA40F7|nr:hypothetical protein PSV08DRAFT_355045 [Bipolaris maydis]
MARPNRSYGWPSYPAALPTQLPQEPDWLEATLAADPQAQLVALNRQMDDEAYKIKR